MTEQDSSNIKTLYDLNQEFYNNESIFKINNTIIRYKSYLIDSDLIDQMKNSISFDKYKDLFKNNITYENFKQNMDKNEQINIQKISKINQYLNSKDLIQALNENKKFYIVTNSLFKKIIDIQNKPKYNFSFSFENNKLLMIFNKEDKIYFLNKNNGFIDKSLIIKNNLEEKNCNNIITNNNYKKPFKNLAKHIRHKSDAMNIPTNLVKMKENAKIQIIKNESPITKPKEENIKIQIKKNEFPDTDLKEEIKTDIEFLLRLYFHLYNLNIIFKNDSLRMKSKQICIFIKRDLIEKYKNFYENNYLENFLNSERIQKIINNNNNNKTNFGYIHQEKINNIILEIMPLLPEEYKCLIQKKNINEFINEVNKDEYYNITTFKYQNPNVINIIDCFLVRIELVNLLMKYKNVQIKNKLNKLKFQHHIIKDKSICVYKDTINIGKLDEKFIFHSEIIIKYNDLESFNEILNDLRNNTFNDFMNNINITEKNIGKYKNSNNQLIILEEQNITQNNNKMPINLGNFITHNPQNKKMNRPIMTNKLPQKENKSNIKLLIYIMLDFYKLKNKIENSNKNGNAQSKFYPINIEFFEQFLKKNNLLTIYQDQNLNKILSNSDFNLSNEEIFKKINEGNFLDKFKIPLRINTTVKNIYPDKKSINSENYFYTDFILLSNETINIIKTLNKYSEKDFENITYFFKDKNIYMIFNKSIEICHMNEKSYIIPEYCFQYILFSESTNQTSLLKKIGYKNYIEKYTLLKKEDYSSPIFLNENRVIGYAYDYSNFNKKDQNDSLLKNDTLIAMLKLYFNYFSKKTSSKQLKKGKYHLVNTNLIKQIKSDYNFSNLESKLNELEEVKQILDIIKTGSDFDELLTNKRQYMIIKELPNEIIKKFIGKNKVNIINGFILEEIDISAVENANIMYYDNFELISDNIYKLLFEKKNKDYLSKYYLDIFSTKKYTYFEIPKLVNNDEQKYILQIGSLNENNIFITKYILIYNSKENYEKEMNNHNTKNDFDSFLDDFNFDEKNTGKIFNEQKNEIGLLFNLDKKKVKNIDKSLKKTKIDFNRVKKNLNINNYEYIELKKEQKPKPNLNNFNTISNDNCNFPKNNFIKAFSPIHNNATNKITLQNYQNIKQEFSKPKLVGLQYIAEAPNFMNAILQCFCQIEYLVNYIKYKPKIKNIIDNYKINNRINLISSFKILVDNLWPSEQNGNNCGLLYNNKNYYFAPYEIKEKFALINNNFKNFIPKDLIDLILNNLHSDLNKQNQYKMNSQLLNASNKEQVFKSFFDLFKNNNCSTISDNFFGIYQLCKSCSSCKTPQYDFDSFNSLFFDLNQIKIYKQQNSQYNNNFSQNLNLQDCFEYQRRIEYNTENEKNICPNCKGSNIYYKNRTIYSTPKILIIALNLVNDFQNKNKFDLWETFYLNNYVEIKINECFYNLRGIVAYNLNTYHYLAYCKSPIDNLWYKYNDDSVNLIDNNNIINEISNNSLYTSILFYQNEK